MHPWWQCTVPPKTCYSICPSLNHHGPCYCQCSAWVRFSRFFMAQSQNRSNWANFQICMLIHDFFVYFVFLLQIKQTIIKHKIEIEFGVYLWGILLYSLLLNLLFKSIFFFVFLFLYAFIVNVFFVFCYYRHCIVLFFLKNRIKTDGFIIFGIY